HRHAVAVNRPVRAPVYSRFVIRTTPTGDTPLSGGVPAPQSGGGGLESLRGRPHVRDMSGAAEPPAATDTEVNMANIARIHTGREVRPFDFFDDPFEDFFRGFFLQPMLGA